MQLYCENPEVRELYENHEEQYLKQFSNDDCGFDLFITEDIIINPKETKLINLKVSVKLVDKNGKNVGLLLYPRSSIIKTPLILHNSVGVIDPKYQRAICMAVVNIKDEPYEVKKGQRLCQLLAFNGEPIKHQLIDKPFDNQKRDGFGSTGI
jgi:dUTP pyrophosphatase